jgi:hypothetical protein
MTMARIDAEELETPEQIYLAASVRIARKVEAMLDAHGIDYVVQVEDLGRSTLFGTRRHAAGFYVTAAQAALCRSLLADAELAHGIVSDDTEGPSPASRER